MQKTLLRSKLHRINVTQVELNYEGSCAVDTDILAKGNLQEYEKIDIYNVTNGERFSTYLMSAEAGSKTVSINGAAAHLVQPGDVVIILSYVGVEEEFVGAHAPRIVLVDSENKISEIVSGESNF